jgi:hypothetical protein
MMALYVSNNTYTHCLFASGSDSELFVIFTFQDLVRWRMGLDLDGAMLGAIG